MTTPGYLISGQVLPRRDGFSGEPPQRYFLLFRGSWVGGLKCVQEQPGSARSRTRSTDECVLVVGRRVGPSRDAVCFWVGLFCGEGGKPSQE